MVQFRAIDRRRGPTAIMRQFLENSDQLQKEVYRDMAADIAERSRATEDTGTYAESHRVGQRSGSFQPTKSSTEPPGKPRGGTGGQASQKGLSQMLSDISGLPPNANNVVFRNEAVHAVFVEERGWGGRGPYRVYAQTRNEAPRIISEAARRLGLAPRGGRQ